MKTIAIALVLIAACAIDPSGPDNSAVVPEIGRDAIWQVGFDCTVTVVEDGVTRCVDCGREWCAVPGP